MSSILSNQLVCQQWESGDRGKLEHIGKQESSETLIANVCTYSFNQHLPSSFPVWGIFIGGWPPGDGGVIMMKTLCSWNMFRIWQSNRNKGKRLRSTLHDRRNTRRALRHESFQDRGFKKKGMGTGGNGYSKRPTTGKEKNWPLDLAKFQ